MKEKLKSNKKILSVIFVIVIVFVIGVNMILFPQLLVSTPDHFDSIVVTNDEVNLNDSNEALGNIISEEFALNISNQNISEEELPYSVDLDSASVVTKYVYESSSFPANSPLWVVIYINDYENYNLQISEKIIDSISDSAWRSGQVWMNDNGDVFAHYDKYVGYVIVEVDAVTGEYNGFNYFADENEITYENSVDAYLKALYNVDFNLTFD